MDNEEHLQNLKARAEELHSQLPPEAKQMAALRSKYDKLAWGALYAAAAGDITSYDDLLHEFVSIGLLSRSSRHPTSKSSTLKQERQKPQANHSSSSPTISAKSTSVSSLTTLSSPPRKPQSEPRHHLCA